MACLTASCIVLVLLCSTCMGSLNLLAFGDSLTRGLVSSHNFQGFHHPYAFRLLELLKLKLPNTKINVTNGGLGGDTVVDPMHQQLVGGRQDNMVMRLDRWLNESEAKGTRYDWVVLMAGINDINSGKKGEEIMKGLEQMYERISRHKARLLAMTAMNLSASDKPFYKQNEEERQKLNKFIRHRISSAAQIKDKGSAPVLVDMESLIPYTNTSQSTLFSDGLHLSPRGYDKMGEEIFNGLSPFL